MDVTSDLVGESAFESVIVSDILAQDEPPADQHAEINARRAQIENPEMLRRLRSL